MKKKTITKAVVLTATILMLTGCNSSTGVNPTTVPETSSAIEQEVTTSTEQGSTGHSHLTTQYYGQQMSHCILSSTFFRW